MAKITVITPFQRRENIQLLADILKGKANWIVLVDDESLLNAFPEWVTVKKYDKPRDGICKSNSLINTFISEGLDKETQYMILCDDDSVEDGFFDKIPDEDVVCVSMKRGDKEVQYVEWIDYEKQQGRWILGIDVLTAAPENMKIGRVGGEQLIIKGKILRDYRYGLSNIGDGQMAARVAEEKKITYMPDAYVLFNYFEDGRYESFKRPKSARTKPLVLFVGDYFCAGQPSMGISEWEGNIAKSLDSTDLADVLTFHMDKYYYHTGKRGDSALVERIDELKPDYIVMIIYKQFGQDPAVVVENTMKVITQIQGVPVITIWGDLEAQHQRDIARTVAPYCYKVIGTANKQVTEELGYTYAHVPKDSRIWNNPNKDRNIDVLFYGSYGLGREERQKYLLHLMNNGINVVAGGSEGRDHFSTEDYADGYKRAKIALSFSKAHGMNVVNARPFEAMSCGALLMEQSSPELAKLYEPGKDYVEWTDEIDLLNKVRYYLEHEDERKQIADSGCKKTQELYSAKTFWESILKR